MTSIPSPKHGDPRRSLIPWTKLICLQSPSPGQLVHRWDISNSYIQKEHHPNRRSGESLQINNRSNGYHHNQTKRHKKSSRHRTRQNKVLDPPSQPTVVTTMTNKIKITDRNAAGGRCTRAIENTQHTHYTHKCEQGCRHWGGTRREGECKGKAAGKRLGPRKVSLNMLHRVRTQPKPKPTKQPLTLNTLSN